MWACVHSMMIGSQVLVLVRMGFFIVLGVKLREMPINLRKWSEKSSKKGVIRAFL